MRRQIEKENKKERNKEKKNYLRIIKDLIEMLKKKDVRYKKYQDYLRAEEIRKAQQKKKDEEEKLK